MTQLIDRTFLFFKDSTGTAPGVHQFKVGMKFEAIDPFNPSHVCVVTVIKVLRFNYFVLGVDSLATYFVCHANSINVFPCGWAKALGLQLHPPRGSVRFCYLRAVYCLLDLKKGQIMQRYPLSCTERSGFYAPSILMPINLKTGFNSDQSV